MKPSQYLATAATWFILGTLAGIITTSAAACQPETTWHITTGGQR